MNFKKIISLFGALSMCSVKDYDTKIEMRDKVDDTIWAASLVFFCVYNEDK